MSTAFFMPRWGRAFAALAAVFCSVVLPTPAAHAAGWGWGIGIGSNGVTVSPQASVNLFGDGPGDRRGYYDRAPYGYQVVPNAVVIVPAQPHYRDPYDDRYWEDEAAPPPRPRHGPGAKHGHGHRHHHRHNGRDYRR